MVLAPVHFIMLSLAAAPAEPVAGPIVVVVRTIDRGEIKGELEHLDLDLGMVLRLDGDAERLKIPPEELVLVRRVEPAPSRTQLPMRLDLVGGDRLYGRISGTAPDHIVIDSLLGDRIGIPLERTRALLTAVASGPRWHPAVRQLLAGETPEDRVLLANGDRNLNALIESVTQSGARNAIVQALIPEVYDEGDKRILLVDGDLLGVVARIPREGDLRSNIHVGGSAAPAQLTNTDQTIINTMRKRLLADRLFFVGLDVIGGKLIEVNVTSPTLLQQMSRLTGENLATPVIERLEQKVRAEAR